MPPKMIRIRNGFATIALVAVFTDSRTVIGRHTELDDLCSRCMLDLLHTSTMAYLRIDQRTKRIEEEHWCHRHQAEVIPVKNYVPA